MVILKYIMIFLVFGISFLIGNLISKKYILRVKELKEMKNAFNIIESKIKFTYETLPEIFLQTSRIVSNNTAGIFRRTSKPIRTYKNFYGYANRKSKTRWKQKCQNVQNLRSNCRTSLCNYFNLI